MVDIKLKNLLYDMRCIDVIQCHWRDVQLTKSGYFQTIDSNNGWETHYEENMCVHVVAGCMSVSVYICSFVINCNCLLESSINNGFLKLFSDTRA